MLRDVCKMWACIMCVGENASSLCAWCKLNRVLAAVEISNDKMFQQVRCHCASQHALSSVSQPQAVAISQTLAKARNLLQALPATIAGLTNPYLINVYKARVLLLLLSIVSELELALRQVFQCLWKHAGRLVKDLSNITQFQVCASVCAFPVQRFLFAGRLGQRLHALLHVRGQEQVQQAVMHAVTTTDWLVIHGMNGSQLGAGHGDVAARGCDCRGQTRARRLARLDPDQQPDCPRETRAFCLAANAR